MSYLPGTIFRYFTADNSKHYTALLLKNGKVLELKNPDTGVKLTFDSFEQWQNSHPECNLVVDDSKGLGVIINTENSGFNYPTENHNAYLFVKWLYSIIAEAAPQFLKSEKFRNLYNQMVDLCNKHKEELHHWKIDFTGVNKYNPIRREKNWQKEWNGYPGTFQKEHRSYYRQSYSREQYEKGRQEILSVYNSIVNLIEPYIKEYLEKKSNIIKTQKRIKDTNTTIKRYQKKVDDIQKNITLYESLVEKEENNLHQYEMDFLALKTASL
jgi:hypothetical protein